MRVEKKGKEDEWEGQGQMECVLLVMSWIGDEGFIPG